MRIVIPKSEALRHLKTNYGKHQKEYDAQIEGWKQTIKDWAKDVAKWAKGNADPSKCPHMPFRPSDHRNDYRTLIRMVGSHSTPEIELDEEDYQRIVLDNFSWRKRFLSTTMLYSSAANKLELNNS